MAPSDALPVLAQIAVALAGFSAIVVSFKRRESGKWAASDADFFNGMVIHSIVALAFCLFPWFLGVFVQREPVIWNIASAVLAVQVLSHAGRIVTLPSTGKTSGTITGAGGLFVVVLQVFNVAGLGFEHEFGPYLVGVLWHIAHASMLFLWLVFIRRTDIEKE